MFVYKVKEGLVCREIVVRVGSESGPGVVWEWSKSFDPRWGERGVWVYI